MVLRKDEADQLSLVERDSAKRLESALDHVLGERYYSGRSVTVDLSWLHAQVQGRRELIVQMVLQLYQEAGWKVEVVPDQRSGDYVRFS